MNYPNIIIAGLTAITMLLFAGCKTIPTQEQRFDVYSQVGEAVLSRYVGEDVASGLFGSLPKLSGNATTIYYLDGVDVTDRIEIFTGTRFRPGQTNATDNLLGELESTAELAELFEALLTELVEKEFSQPEENVNHNKKDAFSQSLPPPADVFVEPVPTVDIRAFQDHGPFNPTLRWVHYEFTFTDGTKLIFKERHAWEGSGEHAWGYVPGGEIGRLVRPGQNAEAVNVNRKIRKGVPANPTRMEAFVPARWGVTHLKGGLLDNGANPTVIRSVQLNKGAVGITADIADIDVRIIE